MALPASVTLHDTAHHTTAQHDTGRCAIEKRTAPGQLIAAILPAHWALRQHWARMSALSNLSRQPLQSPVPVPALQSFFKPHTQPCGLRPLEHAAHHVLLGLHAGHRAEVSPLGSNLLAAGCSPASPLDTMSPTGQVYAVNTHGPCRQPTAAATRSPASCDVLCDPHARHCAEASAFLGVKPASS
jgi:hypothetical protein